MPRPNLPLCQQKGLCPNCKMRTSQGLCIALAHTYFEYKCPFYKEGKLEEHIFDYKEAVKVYQLIHGGDTKWDELIIIKSLISST